MPSRDLFLAVIGPAVAEPDLYALAEQVGAAVAAAGAVLVCGGLGGAMEGACRGAKQAGGTTVGILPGFDRAEANAFVDIAIATGLGEARNALVVRAADGVVAVGGGFGTLAEIGLALKLEKPVVGIRTWELSRGGTPVPAIATAESAEEAVRLLLRLAL